MCASQIKSQRDQHFMLFSYVSASWGCDLDGFGGLRMSAWSLRLRSCPDWGNDSTMCKNMTLTVSPGQKWAGGNSKRE